MFDSITPEHIKHVLATIPDLCIDGLRFDIDVPESPYSDAHFPVRRAMLLEPDSLQQIGIACAYIAANGIGEKEGSYGLKHDMEIQGGIDGGYVYIPNGCAILAAILSGYQIVREPNSPNCHFRRKS